MTVAPHVHQLPVGWGPCTICGKVPSTKLRPTSGADWPSAVRDEAQYGDHLRAMSDLFAKMREQTCACGAKVYSPHLVAICEDCERRTKSREAANDAGRLFLETVPEKFRSAKLGPELEARVTPPRVISTARDMCMAENWLAFIGPAGAGKTSLAVALAAERVRVKREGWRMFQARQLGVARIQHRAGSGEAPLVVEAMTARFALLDDLGQETMTATNPIADIVQARDAECFPTWITTGLTNEETGNRYGGGVARRLFERAKVIRLGARTLEAVR